MINKLEIYSTSDNGIWQKNHSTAVFMEHIDYIQALMDKEDGE